MKNEKNCKHCNFNTMKSAYKYCPICGEKLFELEMEEDGTYKAERKPCRIINDDWVDDSIIYYYKVSPIDSELAWVYENKDDKHWKFGCHISHVKSLEQEQIERCVLRKNNECGHSSSCKLCKAMKL